jgi:hypothetical protein
MKPHPAASVGSPAQFSHQEDLDCAVADLREFFESGFHRAELDTDEEGDRDDVEMGDSYSEESHLAGDLNSM